MSYRQGERVGETRGKGAISAGDVTKLRRGIYAKGFLDAEEADMLFALHDAAPVQDPAWGAFLIKAITDHVVNRAEPRGYVTTDNAAWLIARISQNRLIETKTELELLIQVIEAARWSPPSLSAFALEQVRQAILTNSGPIRSGKTIAPGVITEADVELIRRILCAFGSETHFAVTRAEIAELLAINEISMHDVNHASWSDLFAKALANALMFASGYEVPARHKALRGLQTTIDDTAGDGTQDLTAISALYKMTSAERQALARLERQRLEIVTREMIEADDSDWLAARLTHSGGITPAERTLLRFLKAEQTGLNPKLKPLLDALDPAA